MSSVVALNVSHASLLGTDVSFQFGTNPIEVPPERGYLSFSSVSKNNKLSPSSLFVCDQCSVLVQAVTGESPIRGLRPPWGLIFYSVFWWTQLPSTAMCTEVISSSLARHWGTLNTLILYGCL